MPSTLNLIRTPTRYLTLTLTLTLALAPILDFACTHTSIPKTTHRPRPPTAPTPLCAPPPPSEPTTFIHSCQPPHPHSALNPSYTGLLDRAPLRQPLDPDASRQALLRRSAGGERTDKTTRGVQRARARHSRPLREGEATKARAAPLPAAAAGGALPHPRAQRAARNELRVRERRQA